MIQREYDFGKPLTDYELGERGYEYATAVARDWQSPGTIGRELATLASMGLVTDELGADIAATIREARAGYTEGDAARNVEISMGIADLKILADMLGIELPEDVK